MARPIKEIEADIRSLKAIEKDALLSFLLEEIEGNPDPGVEQAWLEEVQHRSRELDAGTVSAIPADEVFGRVSTCLRR